MKPKASLIVPLLFLIVSIAGVTGCSREAIENGGVQEGRADVGTSESLEEAGVTAKVKTRLARDERVGSLDLLEDIEVETREGVVILMGAVDGETTRAAAEEIARATNGVSGVVNRITVG